MHPSLLVSLGSDSVRPTSQGTQLPMLSNGREDGLFYESVLLLKLSRLFPGAQSFDGHSTRDKQHPPKAREASFKELLVLL